MNKFSFQTDPFLERPRRESQRNVAMRLCVSFFNSVLCYREKTTQCTTFMILDIKRYLPIFSNLAQILSDWQIIQALNGELCETTRKVLKVKKARKCSKLTKTCLVQSLLKAMIQSYTFCNSVVFFSLTWIQQLCQGQSLEQKKVLEVEGAQGCPAGPG